MDTKAEGNWGFVLNVGKVEQIFFNRKTWELRVCLPGQGVPPLPRQNGAEAAGSQALMNSAKLK